MDKLKAFFAKDVVKIVAAGLIVIITGLLGLMPEGPTKAMVKYVWGEFVLPFAAAAGIASGGISGLRSNQSVAVTTVLIEKGVVPSKV